MAMGFALQSIEAMAADISSQLTLWRSARIASALLVVLPFAALALASIAVSATYFQDEASPARFAFIALVWTGPGLILSAPVAFSRFGSAKTGKVASLVGVALFVALSVAAWLML